MHKKNHIRDLSYNYRRCFLLNYIMNCRTIEIIEKSIRYFLCLFIYSSVYNEKDIFFCAIILFIDGNDEL